jgi:hypothetical protein
MMPVGTFTKSGLFAGGGGAITANYIIDAGSFSNSTSYTFSALSFGVAEATREIYVCILSRTTSTGSNPAVTIGGVSATLLVGNYVAGSVTTTSHIYKASVPTGTTGDIVVNYSNSMLKCGVFVYRVTGNPTTSTASAAGTGTPVTANITPATGSLAIACGVGANNDAILSFNGITEDLDTFVEGMSINCGSGTNPATLEWLKAGTDTFQWACCSVGLT